jgi:hypothetical protein
VWFDFLYKFTWNISHSKENWARYDQKRIAVFMWSIRYSCQILTKLEFSRQIFEIHISNFMKIRPVRTELYHADRRTDTTKLIVAFRSFAKEHKDWLVCLYHSVLLWKSETLQKQFCVWCHIVICWSVVLFCHFIYCSSKWGCIQRFTVLWSTKLN